MHYERQNRKPLCGQDGGALTADTTAVDCPACVALFHAVAKIATGQAAGDLYAVAMIDHASECPICWIESAQLVDMIDVCDTGEFLRARIQRPGEVH